MANTTLTTRIVLCSKNTASWATDTTVAMSGEMMIEWTTQTIDGVSKTIPRIKIGDGTHTFAELPYVDKSNAEIEALINDAQYDLPIATDSRLGGVKIGTNISINSTSGVISVANGSTSAKGVVQLSDSTSSTSTSLAATANAVKSAYDRASTAITNAATAQSTAESKVGSVALASGTNNGTLKLTVDGSATDNIAVTGLGSAAYTASTAYATSAQGTKADNAMPKSGGTFTGAVTLNGAPTSNLHAATKKYVDDEITSKLSASDAMVFKGTLGTGGTVTAVPTSNVVKGDTYKVITAGTWAGSTCKVGDLLIAMTSGSSVTANTTNWAYVPSGNENETTVKYVTDASSVTVSTTANTGAIALGSAAAKVVDTSISASSTSANLPTSAAVATFVEGKGYKTTDQNVKSELNTTAKAYITGTTSSTTTTGTQVFDTGVYLSTTAGELVATKFSGALSGNVTGNVTGNCSGSSGSCTGNSATATALAASKNFSITGVGSADAVAFNGSSNVALNLTSVNCNGLVQTSGDTLVLNGNF